MYLQVKYVKEPLKNCLYSLNNILKLDVRPIFKKKIVVKCFCFHIFNCIINCENKKMSSYTVYYDVVMLCIYNVLSI